MAKKLLNEAVVRRFQKLANVAPINETYYNEEQEMKEGEHEDKDKEVVKEEEDALGAAADAPMGDADAPMELGPEDEAPEGDDTLEITDETAQAFFDAVETVADMADKLKGQMGDPAGMDDMGDMGMKDELGAPDDDMDGDKDDMDTVMEALSGINYVPSKNEVVNEVAQRVARRLKEAKLHEAKMKRALGRK